MALETVHELFDFIENSPSCFHVIDNVKAELKKEGFEELCENKKWEIKEGGKYFVTRNLSSVIAFKVPTKDFKSFHIVASHSDSPTFKIKDNPEQSVKGKYVQLNTERYGGMIYSTWFDRPLSVAGRVMVKTEKGVQTRLVNIDRDLLVIPNLAIHMDRTANDGMKYNPQTNLLPLFGDAASKDTFDKLVAEACGVKEEDVIASDLFLYNRTKPVVWGGHNEYMSCAKLDDLECAFLLDESIHQGRQQRKRIRMCNLRQRRGWQQHKTGCKLHLYVRCTAPHQPESGQKRRGLLHCSCIQLHAFCRQCACTASKPSSSYRPNQPGIPERRYCYQTQCKSEIHHRCGFFCIIPEHVQRASGSGTELCKPFGHCRRFHTGQHFQLSCIAEHS